MFSTETVLGLRAILKTVRKMYESEEIYESVCLVNLRVISRRDAHGCMLMLVSSLFDIKTVSLRSGSYSAATSTGAATVCVSSSCSESSLRLTKRPPTRARVSASPCRTP